MPKVPANTQPADDLENSQPNQLRKVVRKQKLDGKEYNVTPHRDRIGLWNNKLAVKFPACARAARKLLAMPATACAVERINSKLGLTWASNRSRLGVETAQDLVYVQCNDPLTREDRDKDVLVG